MWNLGMQNEGPHNLIRIQPRLYCLDSKLLYLEDYNFKKGSVVLGATVLSTECGP